jgi:hypothetical protein
VRIAAPVASVKKKEKTLFILSQKIKTDHGLDFYQPFSR